MGWSKISKDNFVLKDTHSAQQISCFLVHVHNIKSFRIFTGVINGLVLENYVLFLTKYHAYYKNN